MLVCQSDSEVMCEEAHILINVHQVIKYTQQCAVTGVGCRMVGEVTNS